MNILETINNFWIDIMIQRTFLGGRITSIDGSKNIYDTVSTSYKTVERIFFKYYPLKDTDVLVDVGCGKGRVFNYLLYRGLRNKMIGYEINVAVAEAAKKNLSRFKNVEILSENILDHFPKEPNIYYMFNPFNTPLMMEFKELIWGAKAKNPVILYYNPTCLDVFNDDRFTYEVKDFAALGEGIPYKLAIIRIK